MRATIQEKTPPPEFQDFKKKLRRVGQNTSKKEINRLQKWEKHLEQKQRELETKERVSLIFIHSLNFWFIFQHLRAAISVEKRDLKKKSEKIAENEKQFLNQRDILDNLKRARTSSMG